MAAIDDARRFLYLHPYATTAEDNPVQLLQLVVDEHDKASEDEDEGMQPEEDEGMQPEEDAKTKLMTFIKGLRDDLKISEAEYRVALALTQ